MNDRTILHVITTLEPAGAQTQLLGLCRRLDLDRNRILIAYLMRRGADIADLFDKRIELRDLSTAGSPDVRAVLRLARLIGRERVDLVHTHLVHAGVAGKLAAFLAGGPPVVTTRHYAFEGKRGSPFYRLEDRLTGRCARVIAVSEAVRRFLVDRRIAGPERIVVIPNGVDVDLFDPAACAARPEARLEGVEEDAIDVPGPAIGTIGRLERQKGHEHLLRALPDALRRHPRMILEIVGEGRLRADLEALAARLRIERHVRFLGAIPHDRIPGVVARWDLFVLPSLWEGFGIAAAEAMAMERAIVATHVEGLSEIVEDGVSGLLVQPGRPDQLGDAIVRLLDDADLRRRMGRAGRARIVGRFSLESAAASLNAVYEDCLRA